MSAVAMDWLAPVLATDAPAQPALWLAQLWLPLGWSVVLAWLGVVLTGWLSARRPLQMAVAITLAVWTWLPGAWSPAYWLGLAFQLPSLLLVLLCACGLWSRLAVAQVRPPGHPAPVGLVLLAAGGALLGWALLLDTFAVLPVELYACGFSPLAAAALVCGALLPWALAGSGPVPRTVAWTPALAALAFVALRLPSGNAWDAMLDPWLWLALQVWLLRVLCGVLFKQ